jgi:hypothetical protein
LINDNIELMLRLDFSRLLDKLAQKTECQSHALAEIVTAARGKDLDSRRQQQPPHNCHKQKLREYLPRE